MNFFEQQAAARRSTSRLLLLFALAIAGVVLAVDLSFWLLAWSGTDDVPLSAGESLSVIGWTSIVTLALIGISMFYRIASLRHGGDAVAHQLGGAPLPEGSSDPRHRRLRNVVEELAIASGVPMPRLFILEHESAINAFAAGYTSSDAVIGVTRGALDQLNRDELQGVIAHEFSHILNGDMRLNLRLIGLLFGILMPAVLGKKILQFGANARDADKGTLAIAAVALALIGIGAIGLFFARLIKAGVSRSREFLADSSAVQFTRQPSGLAGALKKIAASSAGARLERQGDAEEVGHLLFGDGIGLRGAFATHPPLIERIRRLEPGFDERSLRSSSSGSTSEPEHSSTSVRAGQNADFATANAVLTLNPGAIVAQVARPDERDYARADSIADAIAPTLRAVAASPREASALVLAMLVDADARIAALQRDAIVHQLGAVDAQRAFALLGGELVGLEPAARLPLASIAFSALRQLPPATLDAFGQTVHEMTHVDGVVSVFEYCLGSLIEMQLREARYPARQRSSVRTRIEHASVAASTLLTQVALAGHDDDSNAKGAWLSGMRRLLAREQLPPSIAIWSPAPEGIVILDQVWPVLDALAPRHKARLVEAVTVAISHDARVSIAEAELLRVVCARLHCPLPPMLEEVRATA